MSYRANKVDLVNKFPVIAAPARMQAELYFNRVKYLRSLNYSLKSVNQNQYYIFSCKMICTVSDLFLCIRLCYRKVKISMTVRTLWCKGLVGGCRQGHPAVFWTARERDPEKYFCKCWCDLLFPHM